jgi:hypothetical protein
MSKLGIQGLAQGYTRNYALPIGLARTIYVWCKCGVVGRDVIKYKIYDHLRRVNTVLAN